VDDALARRHCHHNLVIVGAVRREVWGEIRKALRGSEIQFPVPNQTEMTLAPDCYALGLSTNDAIRIQGLHGNHVLVVIDEAPGLDIYIW
jgi:hypothetical protein